MNNQEKFVFFLIRAFFAVLHHLAPNFWDTLFDSCWLDLVIDLRSPNVLYLGIEAWSNLSLARSLYTIWWIGRSQTIASSFVTGKRVGGSIGRVEISCPIMIFEPFWGEIESEKPLWLSKGLGDFCSCRQSTCWMTLAELSFVQDQPPTSMIQNHQLLLSWSDKWTANQHGKRWAAAAAAGKPLSLFELSSPWNICLSKQTMTAIGSLPLGNWQWALALQRPFDLGIC